MSNVVMNVRVKGVGLSILRLRCATPLFRLAAFIAGTAINVDIEFNGKRFEPPHRHVGGMKRT